VKKHIINLVQQAGCILLAASLLFFYKPTIAVAGCVAGYYCGGSTVWQVPMGCIYRADLGYCTTTWSSEIPIDCIDLVGCETPLICPAHGECASEIPDLYLNCPEGPLPACFTKNCCVLQTASPTPTSPPSGPTNTPVPTATPTPTPTPLPCPSNFSVSCAGSGLQTTINWDDLAGAVGYVLRVNKDPYGDWFGTGDIWKEPVNPSQTIDIISDTYYTYDVQGKKSGEAYPYSGARCPFDEFNCPAPTPTPTPYPTVAISGNLREYLRGACFPHISTSNLSVNINPQIPAGVTAACGVTPPAGQTKSSYRCTVVFDNQSTPAQNLNLSSSATGYSSAYWTDANVCTNTANNSLPVDVSSGSSTVYDKDIFFNNSTAWIKLKNSSFSSSGSLTNVLPLNIAAYDSDDDASQRTRRDYRGVRLNNVTLKT